MVSKVAEPKSAADIIGDAIESARAQLQLLVDRGVLIDFDGVLGKLDRAKRAMCKGGDNG